MLAMSTTREPLTFFQTGRFLAVQGHIASMSAIDWNQCDDLFHPISPPSGLLNLTFAEMTAAISP